MIPKLYINNHVRYLSTSFSSRASLYFSKLQTKEINERLNIETGKYQQLLISLSGIITARNKPTMAVRIECMVIIEYASSFQGIVLFVFIESIPSFFDYLLKYKT